MSDVIDAKETAVRAHERIDDLQTTVAGLVPVVQEAARAARDSALANQETAAQIREHVAECRILRDQLANAQRVQTATEGVNRGRWNWAINGVIVALCVMVWDLAKHLLGLH